MAYGGAHNVLPQRQRIAGNGAVVACLRGENAVQRVCDGGAGVNVLPQRQLIAGNGAVVVCLRGDNAVQGVCDWGACMNVLPQRQLIAGNAAVVAKWEGVEWEQMFGPALGLFTVGSAILPPSDGVWSGTRLYGALTAVVHLRTFGR